MYFQIKKIVLWAKNPRKAPRTVSFVEGQLNVISGVSRTGKSAIIPIIDYCLGADRCTIPTGIIRETTAWFGVVVATTEGEKLFARREPGLQQATDDMFVAEGRTVVVPPMIAKNATRDSVKQRLDQLGGLTKLSFSANAGDAAMGRPSFRDLSAFLFQPQNIVANPNVLFYKTDTVEHRQKLRTVFPYVLGAVSADVLAKQHELAQLQRDLRRKESELAAIRNISERWRATIQSRVAEAREMGFVSPALTAPATQEDALAVLRSVVVLRRPNPRVTSAALQEGVEELNRLAIEDATASEELSVLRRRFAEMEQLRSNAAQYRDAVHVQRDRLQVSKWLAEHASVDRDCPICGNAIAEGTTQLGELLSSLAGLEEAASQIDAVPPSFDREMERVRAAIASMAEKLQGIRIRRDALMQRSEEARSEHYGVLSASRFLGKLEAELKTFESVGQDGELSSEVDALRERARELESQISEAEVQRRTRRALMVVNLNAGRLIPHLDAEPPNDPLFLSEHELTVKVQRKNRDDFLWEIGSGSNWLSYHIAVTLGLQQFFLDVPGSPVPSFIIYDQPSQVYFPQRLAAREEDLVEEPILRDQDVVAVQKIFQTMASFVDTTSHRLQIIVLDHASTSVWGGIHNVVEVEDWHDGRALIPADWRQEVG